MQLPPGSPGVRERLLSSALELFTTRGYSATSVREIVEQAGVTKPVLYYYFGSKEGIYLALMRWPFGRFSTLIVDAERGEGGAADRILSLCDSVFVLFVEHLDVVRLMYSIYYGPQQGAPFFDFEGYHGNLQETVYRMLGAGISDGEFASGAVEDMTVVVVGVLNMAMEEQLCRHESRIDRARLQRILRMVLETFRPDVGGGG